MGKSQVTLCGILATAFTIFGIFQTSDGFPTANQRTVDSGKTGRIMQFDSKAQMEEYINKSFPAMLRSNVSPYEYLKARGFNVTGMDILQFLSSRQPQNWVRRRNLRAVQNDASCPVEWNVNRNTNRHPREYMEAKCKRGTCLTSNNQSGCKEAKYEKEVCFYSNPDPSTGKISCVSTNVQIVVACSCEA